MWHSQAPAAPLLGRRGGGEGGGEEREGERRRRERREGGEERDSEHLGLKNTKSGVSNNLNEFCKNFSLFHCLCFTGFEK